MQIVETIPEMKRLREEMRRAGLRIGFVPTMGALHEGHLSLMRVARCESDRVVVSIFVNPTQFGPKEDFSKYPRQLAEDCRMCESVGVDVVFAPSLKEMYPDGYCTFVEQTRLTDVLCGAARPGHFRGVTTVVTKLFNSVAPDVAYFGQKDFQQTVVIKRMAADLDMDVKIVVLPTVREPDGLAMSSRNKYLSASERKDALCLSGALQRAEALVKAGERKASVLLAEMTRLISAAPTAKIDYVAVVDPESLAEVSEIGREAVAALAVRIGTTRLIDNAVLTLDGRNER
ncbi:MAG: pantoate--beta-alanine ligase [Planctomycetes bacterium]|nr:pantoate--beta-alanine ligase [Planctomycetota bacterium]